MRQFKHISFRSQKLITKLIILYSILIILALSTIYLLFYRYTRNELLHRAVTSTFSTLEQIQNNIEINLKQISKLTAVVYSDTTVQDYLNRGQIYSEDQRLNMEHAISNLLIDIMFSHNDIKSVSLYDNTGYYVGSNPFNEIPDFDEYSRLAAEYKGSFCWFTSESPEYNLWAARTVNNYRSEPVGLLLVKYRESSIRSMISSRLNSSDGTIYILDENDRIISCPNRNLINTIFDGKLPEQDSSSSYLIATTYNEDCYITVKHSEYNNWRYVGTIPSKSLDIDISSFFVAITLISILIAIFAICVSFLIARRITHPINMLTKHMKKVDISNTDNMITYNGTDEIAYLYYSYSDMRKKIRQLITDNYEQKLLQNEIEIKMLHMQINPHFLYNTLDSIYSMAQNSENPNICKTVMALSNMMRYSISSTGNNYLSTISGELQHVENYCSIHKLRMGNSLEYFIDFSEDILDQAIPKLTLAPFVENCILHAFDDRSLKKLVIDISGYIQQGKIIISISDNGSGISTETLECLNSRINTINSYETHGIALPNINARIRYLFGSTYGIQIISPNSEGGATFLITLPYHILDNKGE